MTLLTVAALAGALALAPSEAGAAEPAPSLSPAGARPGPARAESPAPPENAGVGGPIEPVELDVSAILVEGRKADDARWTGAVDPALARRYAPRDPVRYNQITIPF